MFTEKSKIYLILFWFFLFANSLFGSDKFKELAERLAQQQSGGEAVDWPDKTRTRDSIDYIKERFGANATVFEQKEEAAPGGIQRTRVIVAPGEKYPIRLKETLTLNNANNTETEVRSSASVANQILVSTKTDQQKLQLFAIVAANNIAIEEVSDGEVLILTLPATSIENYEKVLKDLTGVVEVVEADYLAEKEVVPNDPGFSDQSLWGLDNTGQTGIIHTGFGETAKWYLGSGSEDADIDAPEAWDIIHDASEVIVAVIDTGVNYNHLDLKANMWVNPGEIPGNGIDDDGNGYVDDVHGINAIDGSGDPMDTNGHGTHCAGTIGAVGNNQIGSTGVAWKVQLMALKFIGANAGSTSDNIKCIDYAIEHGAHIMSNSYGSKGKSPSLLRSQAIQRAQEKGIIFVVAAGNDYNDNDGEIKAFPASDTLDNIVSVAATDCRDSLAYFSNYGATSVDLGAPGVNIYSTWVGENPYNSIQGTSMACPHVSGAFALVKARYPQLGYRELIDKVLSTVDPLPSLQGKTVTGGRLNLYNALKDNTPVHLSIHLESRQISENEPIGSMVGELFVSTEVSPVQVDSWHLVAGDGDSDNSSFAISGSSLISTQVFDYEGKSLYSIRIRVEDTLGNSAEMPFQIDIRDVEEIPEPKQLLLTNTAIAENQPRETTIGSLQLLDEYGKLLPPETFQLVATTDYPDNSNFYIGSNYELKSLQSFDFEERTSFSIRVKGMARSGLSIEQNFTIMVSNLPEPVLPENLTLNNLSILENQPVGTLVGILKLADLVGVSIEGATFQLVSGPGGGDNSRFSISGQSLLAARTFDFESDDEEYFIRVRASTPEGYSLEKNFLLKLQDSLEDNVNFDIVLDNHSIAENKPIGSRVGMLSMVAGSSSTGGFVLTNPIDPSKVGTEKWSMPMPVEVASPVSVSKENHVFTYDNNKLYAMDGETGDIVWEYLIDSEYADMTAPALGNNGILYIGVVNSHVHNDFPTLLAFNSSTGEKLWDLTLTESYYGSLSDPIVSSDGTVYISMDVGLSAPLPGFLYAIDGNNGVKKWEISNVGSRYSPVIGNSVIFVSAENYTNSSNNSTISAIDSRTGEIIWKYLADERIQGTLSLSDDGNLYLASGNKLYALDQDTGAVTWEHAVDLVEPNITSPILGLGNTLFYTAVEPGGIYRVYSINLETGIQNWVYDTGDTQDWIWDPFTNVLGSDGTIYLLTAENLYGVDGYSGDEKWKLGIQNYFGYCDHLTLGDNGTLYARGSRGILLIQGSSGPPESGWPMIGQNPQHTGQLRGDIFEFISGQGDDDNEFFQIQGSTLQAKSSFNFETKTTYSIRIKGTDTATDLSAQKQFTISIQNKNEDPDPNLDKDESDNGIFELSDFNMDYQLNLVLGDDYTLPLKANNGQHLTYQLHSSTDQSVASIRGNQLVAKEGGIAVVEVRNPAREVLHFIVDVSLPNQMDIPLYDVDGDGFSNALEQSVGSDPNLLNDVNDFASLVLDPDFDGFTNPFEDLHGLDKFVPNTADDLQGNAAKPIQVDRIFVNGWFYVPDQGWMFTNQDLYPHVFKSYGSNAGGTWLYYQVTSSGIITYYDYTTNTWAEL
jgi:subtilisin family serine protease/outer membrane protein assembly factor BamB